MKIMQRIAQTSAFSKPGVYPAEAFLIAANAIAPNSRTMKISAFSHL